MGMYESLYARYGDCFSLQDDGSGPYIVQGSWTGEDQEPTPQEIAAFLAEDFFYEQVVTIESEYAPQFQAIKSQVLTAFVADGESMEETIADLRLQWAALAAAKDAAIMALFV